LEGQGISKKHAFFLFLNFYDELKKTNSISINTEPIRACNPARSFLRTLLDLIEGSDISETKSMECLFLLLGEKHSVICAERTKKQQSPIFLFVDGNLYLIREVSGFLETGDRQKRMKIFYENPYP